MSRAPEVNARTEIRDGMRVTWHQPIAMNDGLVLRADVYRPIDDGCYPVVLTYGIYAKGLEIVTSCIAVWRASDLARGRPTGGVPTPASHPAQFRWLSERGGNGALSRPISIV
jgi:hypothetical protein